MARDLQIALLCALLATTNVFTNDCSAEPTKNTTVHKIKSAKYKPAVATSESEAGAQIFKRNSCAQCHTAQTSGGCLGPLLTGIGGRRSARFLTNRISAGQKEEQAFASQYGEAELMPHPRLPRADAAKVVAYLLTLPDPPAGYNLKAHAVTRQESDGQRGDAAVSSNLSAQSIARGRKLFYESGCMQCHSIGKIGGQFASALDTVGANKGRNYVSERITGAEMLTLGTNDEYSERGTMMPPSALDSAQIKSITDFLMSLSDKQ